MSTASASMSSKLAQPDGPTAGRSDIPKIPPRPQRRNDRSMSPQRHSFAPSPLNEPTFAIQAGKQSGGSYKRAQANPGTNVPPRPPSVTLPSVGQEGAEYASFDKEPSQAPEDDSSSPTETRNISKDLKLHAPKPGLPVSSAKARISTVTRTDSSQAAAVGIGGAHSDDVDPHKRMLRTKASFTTHDSPAPTERSTSAQAGDSEHGIPEIGQRVPMYPHAGDVQAPTPSPYVNASLALGPGTPSEGHHGLGRHHTRTRSGREHSQLPPGSYGLHGHGTVPQDKFEKAWYEKHPDELERKEKGEYGPGIGGGRGEWALTSEELNRIVRETASRGVGVGTSPAVLGTPAEEIGYIASEEYVAKLGLSGGDSAMHHKANSDASQTRPHSTKVDVQSSRERKGGDEAVSEQGMEADDDDNVIHVDPHSRRAERAGGDGDVAATEESGSRPGSAFEEGEWLDERSYGVPILAPDEVAKDPALEYLEPAVPPHLEPRETEWDSEQHPSFSARMSRTGSREAGSRSNSRPTSMSGLGSGLRLTGQDHLGEIGTPLEDVEEYEPLFPDDEEEEKPENKGSEQTRKRFVNKRIPLVNHRFPSQDVWEDAPSSAQLQATVSTPVLQEDDAKTVVAEGDDAKDSPSDEMPKKGVAAESHTQAGEPASQNKESAKPHYKPGIQDEIQFRPGNRQRFPSRDIWEDSPASLQLQTVVSMPETEEVKGPPQVQPLSPDVEKPSKPPVPARPVRAKGDDAKEPQAQPTLPPRPSRRANQESSPSRGTSSQAADRDVTQAKQEYSDTAAKDKPTEEERKAPSVPDRPKPQVPARPAKPVMKDATGDIRSTHNKSPASVGSSGSGADESQSAKGETAPQPPKPKPAIPARPNGGKIASLKAGFLSDLDKRLQLGPQVPSRPEKPKEAEPEVKDFAPLSDARKGRARGPARRKPAASSPSGVASDAAAAEKKPSTRLEISAVCTIWQLSAEGDLQVASSDAPLPRADASQEKPSRGPARPGAAPSSVQPPSQDGGVSVLPTGDVAAHDPAEQKIEVPASGATAQAAAAEEDTGDAVTESTAAGTLEPRDTDKTEQSVEEAPGQAESGVEDAATAAAAATTTTTTTGGIEK